MSLPPSLPPSWSLETSAASLRDRACIANQIHAIEQVMDHNDNEFTAVLSPFCLRLRAERGRHLTILSNRLTKGDRGSLISRTIITASHPPKYLIFHSFILTLSNLRLFSTVSRASSGALQTLIKTLNKLRPIHPGWHCSLAVQLIHSNRC